MGKQLMKNGETDDKSTKAAELAGLEFRQMIGMVCHEALHCGNSRPENCPHTRMLESGKEEREEIEWSHPDKVFEATVSPLQERTGELKGAVCVMREISERMRSQQTWRESEARFRDLTESTSDWIV